MRMFAILSAAAFTLALSGCATQSGVVWSTDTWERTVTIGDRVYHVTGETDLYGPHGDRIVLDDVPKVGDPGIGVRDLARAAVGFRASERSGSLHLEKLWVRTN